MPGCRLATWSVSTVADPWTPEMVAAFGRHHGRVMLHALPEILRDLNLEMPLPHPDESFWQVVCRMRKLLDARDD